MINWVKCDGSKSLSNTSDEEGRVENVLEIWNNGTEQRGLNDVSMESFHQPYICKFKCPDN